MIDNTYKNAFKEVYVILENTDETLLSKIPNKFIDFLKTHMNSNYKTNIKNNIRIDKQPLLKETEAILALLYRSYWASDEEKKSFSKVKKKENNFKDINDIFEKRKNINAVTIDHDLMVVPKENFINKLIQKIKSIFKK